LELFADKITEIFFWKNWALFRYNSISEPTAISLLSLKSISMFPSIVDKPFAISSPLKSKAPTTSCTGCPIES
jgi:hypothetical protein